MNQKELIKDFAKMKKEAYACLFSDGTLIESLKRLTEINEYFYKKLHDNRYKNSADEISVCLNIIVAELRALKNATRPR